MSTPLRVVPRAEINPTDRAAVVTAFGDAISRLDAHLAALDRLEQRVLLEMLHDHMDARLAA